jgi:hypothetical protein
MTLLYSLIGTFERKKTLNKTTFKVKINLRDFLKSYIRKKRICDCLMP